MVQTVCDDTGQQAAAVRLLAGSSRLAILAHINPDGDTLGSSLALAHALRQRGKEVTVACADILPENLSFLPGYDEIRTDGTLPLDPDVVLFVDASDISRFGVAFDSNRQRLAQAGTINIDHHTTSNCFGDVNLVNSAAAATGEQVYDLLHAMGHPIDINIATCLLTALVTDTRVFRTASTTPRTLAIASQLFERGAPLFAIVEVVYRSRPLATLRLWGLALQRLQWQEGIAWTSITREMERQAGVSPNEGDGVVDLISSLRNVKAVAVLRESDEGIRVSLRAADGVDVSEVASHFGGGGHPRASGCLLDGDVASAERRLVDYLLRQVADE